MDFMLLFLFWLFSQNRTRQDETNRMLRAALSDEARARRKDEERALPGFSPGNALQSL